MVRLENIEETKIEGYEYDCPECRKTIEATTVKRLKYLADEHEKKAHNGEGEK